VFDDRMVGLCPSSAHHFQLTYLYLGTYNLQTAPHSALLPLLPHTIRDQ
jgi:hypothetical protein